ncbi:allatostatin-A receptor-like [Frankliniella occidentalis]|uniref:Allatostatin-A receptor-like n=1 Tax=Frankliniella occidentalis TaxID=133901 RepID=A0A9C6TZM2_FRAOC|nr:allatostatin-A receptor-like [Frankliniella occidentalis]
MTAPPLVGEALGEAGASGPPAGLPDVAGLGVRGALGYLVDCNNMTDDASPIICMPMVFNSTDSDEQIGPLMQKVVSIVVPLIFLAIVVVGLIGNALVVLVVAANQQMRSTTNLLIINLAVADLLFIVFCVPFTGTDYALTFWPLGDTWCKIVQYLIVVTSMASVYTLVLMSLDRFLAVVYPISSMTYRTERNASIAILVMWWIILVISIPAYIQHGVVHYNYDETDNSHCIFLQVDDHIRPDGYSVFTFRIWFFVFAYVLPLMAIVGLYLFMLTRLWHGVAPGGRVSADSRRGKKRVTRMVVVVVAIFATCWAPIQVILVLKSMDLYLINQYTLVLQIFSQVLAYMNSCVNPILYAFLSENFRKAFWKVVSCGTPQQLPEQRNGRLLAEKSTRTTATTTRANGSSLDIL